MALRASVGYLQVAMTGLSVSTKSAIAGIVMMSRVSKLAAAQMALTATAAGVLKGALALIGGPAGLAILAGMAIYKLVDSHDVAKRAAEDHAETLQKLKDELKATAEEASKLLFFKVFHCFGKYLNKLLNYKSIIKLLGLISRKIYQLFSTSVNFA